MQVGLKEAASTACEIVYVFNKRIFVLQLMQYVGINCKQFEWNATKFPRWYYHIEQNLVWHPFRSARGEWGGKRKLPDWIPWLFFSNTCNYKRALNNIHLCATSWNGSTIFLLAQKMAKQLDWYEKIDLLNMTWCLELNCFSVCSSPYTKMESIPV